MTDRAMFILAFVAALGSGLIAGIFYAFSTFVMKALARLPAESGIAAMQAINVAVINPLFLGVFLGTALVSVIATVAVALRWGQPGAAWLLVGGALYVVGTFGVTIGCNVPLNNALAKVMPGDADAPQRWADYVGRWSAWNHVRTAAVVLALDRSQWP
jgi:uncharacterized membrane protein